MKFVHIEEVSVLFPSELNCLESVVSQGSKYVWIQPYADYSWEQEHR